MRTLKDEIIRYQIATYFGALLIIVAACGLLGSWVVEHAPMIRELFLGVFAPVTGPVQRVSELLGR
jgi:hypothetical protein